MKNVLSKLKSHKTAGFRKSNTSKTQKKEEKYVGIIKENETQFNSIEHMTNNR